MSAVNAKKNFSFLCDYAAVTNEGKLCMNGIFEHINTKKFPTQHPMMYLVVNIAGASNGDIFTCELINKEDPSKKLFGIRGTVRVDQDKNFGFIGQLINIVFDKPGEYLLKFYIDNKGIGEHVLWVREVK